MTESPSTSRDVAVASDSAPVSARVVSPASRQAGERRAGASSVAEKWLNILFGSFVLIWRNRTLLRRTTVTDVQTQYAGSMFGTFWLVFGQIVVLGIYTLSYVVIFKIRPADMTVYQYILYVFCGLTSFLAFSGSVSAGTLSLASNRSVLMNTVFPAELIPLRAVLVASAGMPVGSIILLLVDLFYGQVTWHVALIPLIILLQVMFVTGLTWILSLLALVFRDLQYIIYYSIMMLMFITPIAYTPQMMPDSLGFLIGVNPAAYFVINFQYIIMLDRLPPLNMMISMVAISLTMFVVGFAVCRRVKGSFYDFA
jgi:lipopolysaccharide transport system permease protein